MSGGNVIDDYDKANLLNDHFANQSRLHVGDKNTPEVTPSNMPVSILDSIIITEREDLRPLNSLNVNKSFGPDSARPQF